MSHLMNTYAPLNVTFSHGEGMRLFDANGNSYFDALSGIATCSLGHAHPAVTEAITDQASKLIHCSNIYNIQAQQDLADAICATAGMDKVFFANSGAEANEAAIKLARKHGNDNKLQDAKIVVFEGAFHGRTIATLSASANVKIHKGFEPVMSDFVRVPRNDLAAIEQCFDQHTIAAVMLEPTQGEGGINLMDEQFLNSVSALCQSNNALLIFDEIQTGNGRTGSYFAYQQLNITPDVVTTAKGLGNGFPIGACLAKGAAAEIFQASNHGSTFGGNPLGCRVAHAVHDTIIEQQLSENAAQQGAYILNAFKQRLANVEHVIDIRGHGLMIGIELKQPCTQLVQQALDAGLLINVTANSVIRLLPALIINQSEADELVERLSPLIENFIFED